VVDDIRSAYVVVNSYEKVKVADYITAFTKYS